MLVKILGIGNNNFFVKKFNQVILRKSSAAVPKKLQFDTFKAAKPLYDTAKNSSRTRLDSNIFYSLERILKNYKVFWYCL